MSFKKDIELFKKQLNIHSTSSVILYDETQPTFYMNEDQILFWGNLYNLEEVKIDLIDKGYKFKTDLIEEVILYSYECYNKNCLDHFDGAFSFIIYHDKTIFAARDHLGIVPLYYSYKNDVLLISMSIKNILKHLNKAIVDLNGLMELLGLGPSNTPGKTVYKEISSLRAGHYLTFNIEGLSTCCYYCLTPSKHNDDYPTTITKVKHLLTDSIKLQTPNQLPFAAMLSGGIDSSIICATLANNENLTTFSLEYSNQQQFFKSSEYQSTQDDSYIQTMIDTYQLDHQVIEIDEQSLVHHLYTALIARDYPGMVDIDSSLYCFLNEISKTHSVVFSGECADEIFGGYPWFYKPHLLNVDCFPWLLHLDQRLEMIKNPNLKDKIKQYVETAYQETKKECDPNSTSYQQRVTLCFEWIMQNLLVRAFTQSQIANIDCRVPFATKDIFTYLYNVPFDWIYSNNIEKSVLRDAFKDMLPKEVLYRKKNPYPKTYSPKYTDLVCHLLLDSLNDSENILLRILDIEQLRLLIESKGESFTLPWYGQLMMGTQLIAYFYTIYLWGKLYHIDLQIDI